MKKLIFLLISLLFTISIAAQNRVMLQSAGTSSIYSTITAAYNAAVDGDTIYISGGKYAESLSINKPNLVIIGAGYNPDSTQATGSTEIQGTFYLIDDADSCEVYGLHITGAVRVYNIGRFVLSRNKIDSYIEFRYAYFPGTGIISENILNGIQSTAGNITNVIVEKNIIYGTIQYLTVNCSINNNVLLRNNSGYLFYYSNNLLIENNIIYYTYNTELIYGGSTNINFINNNIFVADYDFQANAYGNAILTNNHTVSAANIDDVFVDYDGTLVYNPANNFHLNPDSISSWVGTDGTQIGLYGTQDAALIPTPFKEGTLPFNPHISEKSVAKFTDENGLLQIEFKATSQEK